MFVGTYTRGGSQGIYSYRFNTDTGKLTEAGVAAETENPSFLHITRDGRRLYSVTETSEGTVSSFDVDRTTGKLKLLNTQKSGGRGPCHLTTDSSSRTLVVAHYGNGSVSAFPLKDDGSIGERTALVQHTGSSIDPRRQTGPHAHSVNVSKSDRYAVVADLGLDQYIVYSLDKSKGTLTQTSAAKVKPGSGPRHFSFHPAAKLAYGLNEIASTVTAFEWNETSGTLTEIQTISTLPADFETPSFCAEILVHPSGKYVYASNRGHDSLAMFAVQRDGKLALLGTVSTEGKNPRNFRIHPSGNWVVAANQETGNLVVYRFDKATGKLSPTGEQAKLPFPVCIKFIA